jgi:chromosome segregation ATPase
MSVADGTLVAGATRTLESKEVASMADDYAGLEARVADLEQQMRHVLPTKVDAVSYGVSLVHEETRYLREQSDIHGAALQRLETRLDRQSERLDRQGDLLEGQGDLLERHTGLLQGLETRLDGQNDRLQGLETRLDRQNDRLAGLETQLDGHGDLLQEILRRLPSGPSAP